MAPPSQIGKYELVRKLASGGMAEVYLARAAGPAGFQKTLVVKRILPHLAEDPKFVEMFLGEARLAAALNHPNVVQIFDFGEADDAYYLAMEYVDGPDLGHLWRAARGRLSIPHAVKIISLACEGLDYAHEVRDPETQRSLNIVHRDVSPDNILVARTGAVKVTDFGVAKAQSSSQKTQAGTVKGKYAYMAPEQLRGRADRRSDVYSLAATLYETLAGNRLWDVEGDAPLFNAIVSEPHVPLRKRRPEVPEALAKIVDRALAKDPAERYPSCRAFGADLEGFLRASNAQVGTYELSTLVAELADRVQGPWSQNARSGQKRAPEAKPSGLKPEVKKTPAPAARGRSGESQRPRPSGMKQTRAAEVASDLAERLGELTGFDVAREWWSAVRDPSQRPAALTAAKRFPRTHPIETALGAGSVVLVLVTLWILGSAIVARFALEDTGGMAMFEVHSNPPAKVRVNGVDQGRTPTKVSVDPGPVTVLVYDDALGFRKEETFQAYLGSNPVRRIEVGVGTVEFKVFPGGTIYVDGRKIGEAPTQPTALYEGKHSVRITHPSYKDPIAFELDVKPGQRTTVQKSFLNL